MKQIPTKISRRSLALGGPAAVALAPLAPLASLAKLAAVAPMGAAAVLGGVHTNASALTPTTANFKTWYRDKFHPSAKTIGLDVLFKRYKDLRVSNPTWPAYSYEQSRTDAVMIAMQNKIATVTNGTAGLNTAVRLAIRAGGNTYTAADLITYSDYFYGMTATDLNPILQHHARLFQHIAIFIFHTRTTSNFDAFEARKIVAETTDDRRHLKGTTDDSWVEGKNFLGYPNGKLTVKLGNLRKPVERRELVPNGSFLTRLFRIDSGNTTASEIAHGINATRLEPNTGGRYTSEGLTTSEAYNITLSNNDTTYVGLATYLDADLEKNGALPNMTAAQTWSAMRSLSLFVARDTGLVYESYLAAHLAARAATQAAIVFTRLQLYVKSIDIELLASYYEDMLAATPEVRELAQSSRLTLIASSSFMFAGMLGGLVSAVIAMAETKKIVHRNAGQNTTAATDKLQSRQQTMLLLPVLHSAASLAALGFLNFAAFDPSSSQKNRAQWINTGFAVADLTGAISDYVTVFRAGTQTTNSGFTQLLGGTFQIFTAAIGASDGIYKLTNWSYFRWTSTLSPLVLTSITASAATAFYTMAMAYT